MKNKLGPKLSLYPMPIVLVGTMVNGKPNYITIAHVGLIGLTSVSLSMSKLHYTNAGIKETEAFSVNIPSESLVRETDYCGLVSGKDVDKARLFETFYGELKTAPMIKECPVNMECQLVQTIDFPKIELFVGKVLQTYCSEEYMAEGIIDFGKVKPILFVNSDKSYRCLGKKFAEAWNIGKEIRQDIVVETSKITNVS